MYASLLDAGTELTHVFRDGRSGWLQVVRGNVTAGGEILADGDGASIDGVDTLEIRADSDAEILLFDLR